MTDAPFHRKEMWWKSRGRVLVVGDIHGEFDMFERLLKLTKYDERKDLLFALGDLIDRGPQSKEVLDWFARDYGCASLLGNHEAMMVAAATSWETERIWHRNGGDWARDLSPTASYLYRCMIRQMPLTGEIEYASGLRVGLVHAEVRPGLSWSHIKKVRASPGDATNDWLPTNSASAIWGRSRFIADSLLRESDMSALTPDRKESAWKSIQPVKGIDVVISGHSVTPDCMPRGRGNVFWIDTGAGFRGADYQGRLTAADPLTRKYWQVGRNKSETWGPLPWPVFEPVPSSLRPTRREIAEAKKIKAEIEAQRKETLRLFGF